MGLRQLINSRNVNYSPNELMWDKEKLSNVFKDGS